MGFVTNDKKSGDEQQPGGGLGLSMDLDLRACPECRREVLQWQDSCPDCGVQAVARTSLATVMPDIPAHLLVDDDEDTDATDTDRESAGDRPVGRRAIMRCVVTASGCAD